MSDRLGRRHLLLVLLVLLRLRARQRLEEGTEPLRLLTEAALATLLLRLSLRRLVRFRRPRRLQLRLWLPLRLRLRVAEGSQRLEPGQQLALTAEDGV